jgi:predicted Zn finger-like uncharacterized protein
MIVICEECGKKYRIDREAIEGERARFKCRTCGHMVLVEKAPETPVDDNRPAEPGGGPPEKAFEAESAAAEEVPTAEPDETAAMAPPPKKRGMGLRAKMMVLFLVIPIMIIAGAGIFYIWQMNSFASAMTRQTGNVVTKMGQQVIRETARTVASQCRQYLLSHPDLDPRDFMKDENFKKIAIQKVGLTGYTALYAVGPMVTWAHPNPKIIGRPLTPLVKKPLGASFGRWVNIIGGIDKGENIEKGGYYTWTDADGELREKYMFVTPVEGTKYGIAATIYQDEFTRPLKKVQRDARKRTASVRNTTMAILAGTLLLVGIIVLTYSNLLTTRIRKLTDHAERISVGDLDVELDVKSDDEIGDLGEAIRRMQDSIRLSIQRLRRRR